MAKSTFSIRIDPDMKRQFDGFCADVGMNPSTAINMFVRVVVRDKKLPFEVSSLQPSEQDVLARAADTEIKFESELDYDN
jgi:addiction module RelB/DinJ family antitoxin